MTTYYYEQVALAMEEVRRESSLSENFSTFNFGIPAGRLKIYEYHKLSQFTVGKIVNGNVANVGAVKIR